MRCGALTLARALPLLRRVPAQEFYQALFATIAFVLGASIGSFLNVCIYRMPLDISVSEPRRSGWHSARRCRFFTGKYRTSSWDERDEGPGRGTD